MSRETAVAGLPGDRHTGFVVLGVAAHAALLICGHVFLGALYTALISAGWSLCWMLYCGAAEAAWEADDKDYSAGVSVPALALIGGPLCWLLCPQCLSPAHQRGRAAFSALWTATVIVLMSLRASVLKIMAWLHSWSVAEFPADQGTDNAPGDSR